MANYGFFRIMASSPEVFPGDTGACAESIKREIGLAYSRKASLLVLPELCVTGASCGDMYLTDTLLSQAEKRAVDIAEYTEGKDILVCFSVPLAHEGSVYSTALFAAGGKVIGAVPLGKRPGSVFSEYTGEKTSVRIGNDLIPFGKELVFRSLENRYLSISVGSGRGTAVSVIPAASLECIESSEVRREQIRAASIGSDDITVYCSAGKGESTASGVYSGHILIAEEGKILSEILPFKEGYALSDVDLESVEYRRRRRGATGEKHDENDVYFSLEENGHDSLERDIPMLPFVPSDAKELHERCVTALEIQGRGLAERLRKIGSGKAVLGVSGGLDSTLALLASVKAMSILGRPAESVIAVSMPCFGTSSRTRSNAEKMCELLGVDFRLIDISDAVSIHLREIGHDGMTSDTAYENAQARERTQVLMDISNMENGIVVGTGDMSESALGWCTFNGDHMSMYNVNCSVPKTFIRSVVSDCASSCGDDELREVLLDVVATPVSPELKPAERGEISQKTEEIIGPYDAHDFFLYHFIRNGSGPEKILFLAQRAFEGVYTADQLKEWVSIFFRRFFSSQFKRNCVPEGPVIGSINLSLLNGWNMPGDISGREFLN